MIRQLRPLTTVSDLGRKKPDNPTKKALVESPLLPRAESSGNRVGIQYKYSNYEQEEEEQQEEQQEQQEQEQQEQKLLL